jgi:hypothetical protein
MRSLHAPLQIELARTGSVGVTHAPMIRLSKNVKPGINAHTSKLQMNQATDITPDNSVVKLIHSRLRYALGSDIPVNSTWIAMTIRVNWWVRYSGSSVHFSGEKMSAPIGPNAIPANTASSASADGQSGLDGKGERLRDRGSWSESSVTGGKLTNEKAFLDEIAHEADKHDITARKRQCL